MKENGPSNTINPNGVANYPLEKLFTPAEIREKREEITKAIIAFNKRCWKSWCKRNDVDF